MKDLVSIIIPCYRQAHYLAEAVDSAFGQTYARIEVIVVNDGSPDNTREVVRRYGDRITYLEQENRGLAAARNSAIAKSKGRWLQFLDADDLLHRYKLQWQIGDLAQNGARLGYCCTATFEKSPFDRLRVVDYPGKVDDMFFALASLWERTPIPIHSLLISREIFEWYGRFPEDMRANEDRLFFAKVALAGERFHFTPIVGAFYRMHPNSMNRDTYRMLDAHYAFLQIVWQHALTEQMSRDLVRKVVMRSLLHIVNEFAARGCSWRSIEPVLQFYLDVYAFQESSWLFRRVVPRDWRRRLWILKQRARLKL